MNEPLTLSLAMCGIGVLLVVTASFLRTALAPAGVLAVRGAGFGAILIALVMGWEAADQAAHPELVKVLVVLLMIPLVFGAFTALAPSGKKGE